MQDTDSHRLSIVIPAWNEEEALPIALDSIVAAIAEERLISQTEIVVVSDGSSDRTVEVAADALRDRVDFTVVDLVGNVGSHSAIRCGLEHATGQSIVILSADGQDPPEAIGAMLQKLDSGSDIVWGQRENRDTDPFSQRASAGAFYRIFRWLTALDYPPAGLDFVAFTSQVNDAVKQHGERNMPLFLLIYNLGFRQAVVPYERAERVAGSSGWSFRKRLKMAIDMLTAFSATPMRLISLAGVVVALLGLSYGLFTMVRALLVDIPVSGWSSMIVLTSVMGGLILLGMAAQSEYIWRTLDETRGRPIYLERRVVSSRSDDDNTRS